MIGSIDTSRLKPVAAGLLASSSAVAIMAAVAFAPNILQAADLTWDTDGATAGIQNGNGDWDEDGPGMDNPTDNWDGDGSGNNPQFFDDGDTVTFDGNAGAGSFTVTVTEDVSPLSITFGADAGADTDFLITGSTITGAADVLITMDDAAAINSELVGEFSVGGTQLLTLGGTSNTLTDINVELNAQLTNTGTIGGNVDNDGTFTNSGTVNGNIVNDGTFATTDTINNLTSNAGSAALEGTANGDVDIQGGTVSITGTGVDIAGTLTLADDIVLTIDNTETVTTGDVSNGGDITINSGGELEADTGSVVNNATGNIDLNSGGTITGNVTHNGASFDVGGTVTGNVQDNVGLTLESTGDIDGTLTLGATAAADIQGGDIGAVVVNNGTSFTISTGTQVDVTNNTGTSFTLNNGGTLAETNAGNAALSLDSGAEFDSAGQITSNDGTFTITAGTIDLNTGTTLSGDIRFQGDIENAITLTFTNGYTLGGTLTNEAGGTVNINTAMNTGGNDIVNNGNTAQVNVNAQLTGGIDNQDGTVDVDAAVTGTLTNADVATVSANVGAIDNNTGGDLDFDGSMQVTNDFTNAAAADIGAGVTVTVGGNTTNENGGTLTVAATGGLDVSTNGLTNQNGGNVVVDGTITGNVTNQNGGTINTTSTTGQITGTLQTAGGVTIDGAETLTVGGGTTVQNNGQVGIAATGQLASDVAVETGGTVNLGGTITGNVDMAGGDLNTTTATAQVTGQLDTAGNVDVGAGEQLTVTGLTTVENSGQLTVAGTGTVLGDITVDAGGTIDLNGGTLGSLALPVDPTTLTVDGTGTLDGTLNGSLSVGSTGDVTIDGATTVSGAITNDNTITANAALDWNTFTNNDTLTVNTTIGAGATTGLLTSGGSIVMNNSAISSRVNSTGSITVNGTGTFNSGLTSSGLIDMQDGATDDQVNITASALTPANLDGSTVQLDSDLSGATNLSDTLNVTGGALSGDVTLAFANSAATFDGSTSVDVLTYDPLQANSFNLSATGLAAVGTAVFFLNDDGAGTVSVQAAANPNIGGLAGAVVLTQSLIGSVVNRPSSPFVAGLGDPGDEPCGPGVWGRATGGSADISGTTEAEAGTTTVKLTNELSAEYAGFQLGADYSCFGGYFNGWDLSFGGILGINAGTTKQPLFAIDPNTGDAIGTTAISTNTTDFTQTYAGGYISAFRNRLLLDLQYRIEQTEFDLTNSAAGTAASAGIIDQKFNSEAQTLSGSVSYLFPVSPENGLNFIPTAGFSISQTSTDSLAVDDDGTPGDTSDDGRLEIDDFTNQIGFIGGTLSKTNISASGQSALTYFGTATYYRDFADSIESQLFDSATDTSPDSIKSPNLGEYGEVSIGLNYTRFLGGGDSLPRGRQLNASVRLDGRVSETLESWGVTGQVRLQF